MKLKKILASILALTMMFSMMSFSVSAENTVSVWDGTIDRTWYDDNPTADSYTITTAAQFAGIADICNTVASNTGVHPFKGQTIYLGVDINLNGNNFSPIGDASGDHRYFYGSFDGQGHTISNIKIESDSAKYVGLFGKTGNPSYNQTFEDVTLENVTVLADGAQFVGGLIGRADESIVTNVNVIGEIRISGDRFVGGVLGHSYAQISDCSVEASGTINANTWQAGGLVGAHYAADGASVSNCSVNGGASDLTVTSNYAAAGGVIGTVTLVDGVEPVIDGITVENVTVEADSADYGSGLALVASGYNATNATVSNVTTTVANEECVPADAEAKIGDVYYTSFYEAAKNATADTTIEVLADSTVDEWQYMDAENISIDGKNHSVTINAITKNTSDNQGSLIRAMNGELNIKDITFNLCAGSVVAQVTAGTMENVTVNGGKYGYLVDGATTIKNCVFNGQSGAAIYFRDVDGAPGSVVDGCTFNLTNSRAACLWTNEVFTNNIINGADNLYHGLTILADSTATVSGNKFDSKSPIEVYVMDDAQGAFKLTKNVINGSVFVDGATVTNQFDNSVVENNTLSDAAIEGLKKINEDVVSVDYVATVNGKAYYSLADAVAALEEGDTLAIASGRYDGFDILVDDVTITGMTPDAEITINSIPGNAFIGINAEGVSVENLTFVVSEGYEQTGDYLDGFDAVIGYWSNNFNAGSNVTTGYNVEGCTFINNSTTMGVAMFNFSSFEIVGNTFENFNVGIHTMSDGSAMGDVVINGNTFINVNEPVNVYWGQTGNDDDSIAITGNNFVSAKDADEIKITIHDYASTAAGTAGIDAIDLSGNTFSAATEVELVDAATDISSTVESTLENVENVIVDTKYAAVARIGEDKYFTSIEAAVAGAQANDVITIFAGTYNGFNVPTELNNVTFVGETDADGNNLVTIKTLEEGIESHTGGVFVQAETTTFKNLNFTAGETIVNSRVSWMTSSLGNTNGDTGMRSSLKNLTVENCNFVGSGVQYAIWTNQGNVTVKNSTITNYATGIDTYAIGADQKMIIENTEITDVNNAFHTGEAKEGSEIIVTDTTIDSNLIHVGGAVDVTVTDSEIKNAVIKTYTANNAMNISNTLFINSVIDETAMGTYNGVNIAEDYDAAVAAVAANNEIISTKLNISFRQVEAGLYDIVLDGEDDIYEFVGAELTFDNDSLTAGNEYMNYEILGINGTTNAEKSIEKDDTYALRLVDGAERMSGRDLVIGQVKFFGQGDINFTVSEGKVVTTEYGTNLGQYYTLDADDTTADTLTVNAITNGAVEEVTRDVVVNVAYKHALNGTYWKDAAGNAANQITVTLKDGFGNIYGPFDVSDELETIPDVKLGRLTVTLEAPGFRRYVYNTTLEAGADENDALVLNFWNDIKRDTVQSPLAEIEAGVSGETNKNFVVGDIVMDYTVDEYDLAAVTSYYGMYELTDADKYIKYDLNRDGNIDIIDVHYVLHTLNN